MEIILKYFSDFTSAQVKQFALLEKLYKDWNSKINVISRLDIDHLYERHVLHSLAIAAVFDFRPGAEIIDIGTGGGFPGIPLAVYFPDVRFHLVDSIGKKLKVVNAIAEETGLKNISTQHTRAEEIKGKKFDYAVSRAVAPLKDLWKWSKPLLKNQKQATTGEESSGGLICLKGGDLSREISESKTRPRVYEISHIFNETFFRDKYLVHIPAR
jgi:16S rRNA (guanine527-N7)-methyltransferase